MTLAQCSWLRATGSTQVCVTVTLMHLRVSLPRQGWNNIPSNPNHSGMLRLGHRHSMTVTEVPGLERIYDFGELIQVDGEEGLNLQDEGRHLQP